MLASYIRQKNKNAILLSSSHSGMQTVPEKANKPKLIFNYNYGKKGVDQFDENVEMFTCRWKTVRRPLQIFFNALDVAASCAHLLFRKDGHNMSQKVFLKNLSKQLAHSSAVVRHTTNTRLPRATKEAAFIFGFLPEVVLTKLNIAQLEGARCAQRFRARNVTHANVQCVFCIEEL